MKLQDYVQNKPILETDRLLLRPLQYSDVADLKEWLGDISKKAHSCQRGIAAIRGTLTSL